MRRSTLTGRTFLKNAMIVSVAATFVGGQFLGGDDTPRGPVSEAVAAVVSGAPASEVRTVAASGSEVTRATEAALNALSSSVTTMSDPRALETAFSSYFAYKAKNPDKVRKPYLYFVDYGLSNTTRRGYVFDMDKLEIVDGPFAVAAGRGSPTDSRGVPVRFSNEPGSAATSLGLYLAQETYSFSGKAGGARYTSIGLRMAGVSGDFNDNARARGVVAHGAPYVSANRAGRSEGCPAMEQARAQRLLPMLANGGMVFHYSPQDEWLAGDPWIAAAAEL
jgi:hypothetical protein